MRTRHLVLLALAFVACADFAAEPGAESVTLADERERATPTSAAAPAQMLEQSAAAPAPEVALDLAVVEHEMAEEKVALGRAKRGAAFSRDEPADGDGEDGLALPPEAPARGDDAIAPPRLLPRSFYFENNYLGGNAAHLERTRRLAEALGERAMRGDSRLPEQDLDPPPEAGIGLSVSLDRRSLEKPGRVILQVALRGSDRFGWRRPPLDLVLVVDGAILARGTEELQALLLALLQELEPQDRVGVLVAGAQIEELIPLDRAAAARSGLARRFPSLVENSPPDEERLAATFARALHTLRAATTSQSSLPGTQTVVLVTSGDREPLVPAALAAAHEGSVQGVVTSVIELDATARGSWWRVAEAGGGSFHRVTTETSVAEAVQAELSALSRVVARLVRVNIRLGKHSHALRVLGSRALDSTEVRDLKARELATDEQLSATLGIQADRGEDDDGIQTVIPAFFGGDSHVILVELWVERPGLVAEVSLRYKDMVNLRNATAQGAAALSPGLRPPTAMQGAVARNTRGFAMAEALERAGHALNRGARDEALARLTRAGELAPEPGDRALVSGFVEALHRDATPPATLAEALFIAGRQRVGLPERSALWRFWKKDRAQRGHPGGGGWGR